MLHIILYFVLLHKADLPEHNIDRIKTKLRSVCKKYHNVKTPYKHRAIINNLLKNKDIVILGRDKGRAIVILNLSKYLEKCLSFLDSNQFKELYYDSTYSVERKVTKHYEKLKQNFQQTLILLSNNKLVLQATTENLLFDVFAILILSRSYSIFILKQSAL